MVQDLNMLGVENSHNRWHNVTAERGIHTVCENSYGSYKGPRATGVSECIITYTKTKFCAGYDFTGVGFCVCVCVC